MSVFGIAEVSALIDSVVNKIWPDKNIVEQGKIDELKIQLNQELQYTLGQLEINKIEAANPSVFVAGWRPATGWTCSLGFAYEFLLRPLGNGIAVAFGGVPVFPGIEVNALSSLLFGLLGLGTLRTVEKVNNVARNK